MKYEEEAPLIHIPCLFPFGSQDDNKEEILNREKIMPGFASCVEIEGAGHGQALLKPQFLPAVLRFFVDQAARQGRRP